MFIGFGPIAEALTELLLAQRFSVAIVSDNAISHQKMPVISRKRMIELGSSLEASNIVVSARADKWESKSNYENFVSRLPILRPKKVFLLSSVSVYGDSDLPRNEDSIVDPVTKYGLSKAFEEKTLRLFKPESVQLIILRISNVFGHQLFDDFVNNVFLSAKLGKPVLLIDQGKTTRNFIWFHDLIIVLSRLLTLESLPQFLNIGSSKSINLRTLVSEIERILGKRITIVESGEELDIVANSIIDTSKLRQLIDYKTTDLVTALENYYLEDPFLIKSS